MPIDTPQIPRVDEVLDQAQLAWRKLPSRGGLRWFRLVGTVHRRETIIELRKVILQVACPVNIMIFG